MIAKPIEVKTIEKYKIFVRFSDRTEGIVDISDMAGKGIFKMWDKNNNFSEVYINKETDGIAWNDEVEICPETVYLQIKKLSLRKYKRAKQVA